jgi:hypothetical protein
MGWTRTLLRVPASLAGFSAGGAVRAAEAAEEQRDRRSAPRRGRTGLAASGPGYFVWDEDPRHAVRWAAELAGGPSALEPRDR